MKKTIRKPENWQDFESLCKKLWGEIWGIPSEIKKNGRLGQPQSGIDVYGIPKGKNSYFGIQAKGKDDYSHAKLESIEIEKEIQKAKEFRPEIEEFIIATSANKDSKIEEFIRLKDIESRSSNGFKILLFCWEDIADLIEENKDTFNWYVNENNFREKFDVNVTFTNNSEETDIVPNFKRVIKSYKKIPDLYSQLNINPGLVAAHRNNLFPFENNKTDKSWNKIKFQVENVGSLVLEDWKIFFHFDTKIRDLDDDFQLPLFMANELKANLIQNRTTYIDNKNNILKYLPLKNSSLIQKDSRIIPAFIKVHPVIDTIVIRWKLLARDFNKEGILKINTTPNFIDEQQIIWVKNEKEIKNEQIIEIKDYIV
ncbi:hypothetical protein HZP98_10080 [Elizabethkingia anophelis]|nr:hypothetical protein [Elizabethkingia anophelis]MCT3952379.1 hypothetical protein [Elizabethkingia anophelis]MCT3955922.1 hypothetical protein [Elizabethkingia anophelis]MCT3987612.1 hypothetical protein [Elizabethkingia anophelis]MCT4066148.1 hypothetical protein [Elizabethkingia anophelis]